MIRQTAAFSHAADTRTVYGGRTTLRLSTMAYCSNSGDCPPDAIRDLRSIRDERFENTNVGAVGLTATTSARGFSAFAFTSRGPEESLIGMPQEVL